MIDYNEDTIAAIATKLGVGAISIIRVSGKDAIPLVNKIFSGKELGKGKGGISFLTKNEVSRIDLTRNAFIMALTKHINGNIWR